MTFWRESISPILELPVLVLVQGWQSFFVNEVDPSRQAMATALHQQIIEHILPQYLPSQRWFAGKGVQIERVEFEKYAIWTDRSEWLLAQVRVWLVGYSEPQDYGLPLALFWEEDGNEKLQPLWPDALARVRVGAKAGLLYGAYADERFCQTLVKMIGRGERVPLGQGWLKFSATSLFAELAGPAPEMLAAKRLALDSSNTTIAMGDRLLMKGYRRLQPGISPELEMGRFLTAIAFPNIAPLAGALEYEDEAGNLVPLVLLQGFIANQGDAWSYTLDYLKRFLMDCLEQPDVVRGVADNAHTVYLLFAATLGQRTGELHRALAQTTGDPAFDPEPITADDLQGWVEHIRGEASATLDRLEQARSQLPEPAQTLAGRLLAAREAILARLTPLDPSVGRAMKTRYHGDYHLGQVLMVNNDVIIIDFEGEPSRPLLERRAKQSPLRDVVGMLRSFNYAAHAALRQATANGACDRSALWPLISAWQQQARAAFMHSYLEAVGDSSSYPADPDQAQVLLDLFALEKGCYELRYELDNRPDWAVIPLEGLCELLIANPADAPD